MFVKRARARIIYNSRKEQTIEIELKTYEGVFKASAPAGKSRGKHEVEPYNIAGIKRSLELVKKFLGILTGRNFRIRQIADLEQIEKLLQVFENRQGKIGGNVRYTLHTVFLRAAAKDQGIELWELLHREVGKGKTPVMPMPVGNCIGGGLHSAEARGKKPDFQEFLLIPKEKTFARAVTVNVRAYQYAKTLLHAKKQNDEHAWRTDWSNEEVLEVLQKIAKRYHVRIGIDAAASTFFSRGYYSYFNKELIRDKTDQADYMAHLIKKYELFYTEDPMEEEDFGGFAQVLNETKNQRKKNLIVGDDLTTTNTKLLERAIHAKAIHAIIIKPNQIGSIIETARVVAMCKKHKITMVFSHRSGETMDDALADYCVGFGGHFIKAGIMGPERLIKLKRVMDIEKRLLSK